MSGKCFLGFFWVFFLYKDVYYYHHYLVRNSTQNLIHRNAMHLMKSYINVRLIVKVHLKEHLDRLLVQTNLMPSVDWLLHFPPNTIYSEVTFYHIPPCFGCLFFIFSTRAPPSIPVAMPRLTSGLQYERSSFPLNVSARQHSHGLCFAGSHSSSSVKLLFGPECWTVPGPSGPACRINKNIHQRRLLFSKTHNEELTKQCSIYVSL